MATQRIRRVSIAIESTLNSEARSCSFTGFDSLLRTRVVTDGAHSNFADGDAEQAVVRRTGVTVSPPKGSDPERKTQRAVGVGRDRSRPSRFSGTKRDILALSI